MDPFLNHSYRSTHPLCTFYRLLNSRPRHILAIQAALSGKAMPAYLAPVFLAEVVRVSSTRDSSNMSWFITICVGYGLLLLANPALTVLAQKLISIRTRIMERQLRSAVVHRLQQLSIGFHRENQSGSLQAKVLRDVESILMMAKSLFHQVGISLTGLLVSLGVVAYRDWRILLFFLLTAPPAAVIMRVFARELGQRNRDHRRRLESMSDRVGEMINLIPVTRAHGAEEHEIGALEEHLEKVQASGSRLDTLGGWFQACSGVTMQLFGFVLIAVSGVLVLRGTMPVDRLVLYNGLYYMTIGHLGQLLNMTPMLTKGLSSLSWSRTV